MRKILSWLLVFAFALALGACAGDSDKDKTDKAAEAEKAEAEKTAKEEKKKQEAIPICPQVAILRDLEIIRDYGQEKPAPNQLVAEARMKSVDGDCEYTDTGIDIKFDLSVAAAKGPRLGGLHSSFPYFVAIVDPNGDILSKEQMTEEIGFSSGDKITDRAESLHVFIPLAKDKRITGPYYRVLMGFQLTKEQLDDARTLDN